MKLTSLFVVSAICIAGCSTSSVPILGSKRGWSDPSEIKVLEDISVSGLRIRVTTPSTKTDCAQGAHHFVEIDGPINEDTTFALKKIFVGLPPCISSNGKRTVKTVYLNSGGGTLRDGFAIGELFRSVGVSAWVLDGQVCASACAVAFLGSTFREMGNDAKLIFHAPYRRYGSEIRCADRSDALALRDYYRKMIPQDSAERLFKRTMDYCSDAEGWTVDAGAAKLFGILGQTPYQHPNPY